MKSDFFAPFYVFVFLFVWSPAVNAQYYILGRGLDEEERPYAFAKAELHGEGIFKEQTCTELGVFKFENLKSGTYEVVFITPYGIRRKKVELRGSIDVTLHIPRNIRIDEISVVARRAGSQEPVTHDNITSEEIRKKDSGQDLPYLLEGSPSLVVTSDAGHGIGYTGLRIRGTDPTRINVTLNGIPVNDAESHNVFWVDLPDIAGSTNNIQVQRGAGWSQPGVGDFGGGIHINTLDFHEEPYASIQLGAGSFATKRASAQIGSGLWKGRFTVDGRASYLQSEGFVDRSSSDLYSLYGAAGYHHDDVNVRFVVATGDELTYQAWNGLPAQYVNTDLRTFNTAGTEKSFDDPYDNEVDDYRQTYYQLHADVAVTPFARLNNSIFYTRGKGFFEQYKADQAFKEYGGEEILTDLVRQLWLDNHYYGFNSTLQIGKPLERYLVLGGGWNQYLGDHFGEVIWTEADVQNDLPLRYYFNEAKKRDWNLFGRTHIKLIPKMDAIVDLQMRWVKYAFEGPDMNGVLTDQEVDHTFFNPKAGLQYIHSEKLSLYGLSGYLHKEPNRDDYISSTPNSRPTEEKLWDNEIGVRYRMPDFNLDLTGYYMSYKDQLVPTGRLNDVGAYTRVNIEESYRFGVELSIESSPVKNFSLNGQLTLSDNKIKSFDEYIDNWDDLSQEVIKHHNTQLAFSPGLIAGMQTGYKMISGAAHEIELNLQGKFVGEQYVDNTSREASLIDEYLVFDGGIRWTWHTLWAKDLEVAFFAKNLFDHQYESNGWIYRFRSEGYDPRPDDAYAEVESGNLYHLKGYYPQAGRHFFVSLAISF